MRKLRADRLTSMATKSTRRHAKRGTGCVYTQGKFDFLVGLQYSIISWVDRDATSAVENPPYPEARLPPPSVCYVVRGWGRGGFMDALGLGWKWRCIHYRGPPPFYILTAQISGVKLTINRARNANGALFLLVLPLFGLSSSVGMKFDLKLRAGSFTTADSDVHFKRQF